MKPVSLVLFVTTALALIVLAKADTPESVENDRVWDSPPKSLLGRYVLDVKSKMTNGLSQVSNFLSANLIGAEGITSDTQEVEGRERTSKPGNQILSEPCCG